MLSVRTLAVAIAIAVPNLAFAQPGPRQGPCQSDIKAFCGSVQPGGGRIRDCMREHRAQLSTACKVSIAERMLERGGPRPGANGLSANGPGANGSANIRPVGRVGN